MQNVYIRHVSSSPLPSRLHRRDEAPLAVMMAGGRGDVVAHLLDVLGDAVKVAALVVRVEVGLAVKLGVVNVLVEDGRNVGGAHERQAQRLEAVVDVHAAQHAVLVEEVGVQLAPVLGELLNGPAVLADEVLAEENKELAKKTSGKRTMIEASVYQAVELVIDFSNGSVDGLLWVAANDLVVQVGVGLVEGVDALFGDGHCVV